MTDTHTNPGCPALSTLAEWFEGTLDQREADRVEQHFDHCSRCRERALDWSEGLEPVATDVAVPAGCIDAETLVAYGAKESGLARSAVARIEQHLQRCTRCVGNLQHVMRLQRQLDAAGPIPALATQPATEVLIPQTTAAAHLRLMKPTWWQRLSDLLTPKVWTGAAFAAAMALVIAIGVSRFTSPSGPDEEMRVRNATQAVTAEVTTDTVGRPRPSADEPVLVELSRGTQARWLEAQGNWTRIELADGRRVWVPSAAVARIPTE